MIRVQLPVPLRRLANIDGELRFEIDGPATQRAVIDALEAGYPALRGTLRDHATGRRRAYVRFFAAGRDLSNEVPDAPLPAIVARGEEPFIVIGALSGG